MKLLTKQCKYISNRKTVTTDTNVLLGYFDKLEDGYYAFLPIRDTSYFDAYSLELVRDKLLEVNKEWNEQCKKIEL